MLGGSDRAANWCEPGVEGEGPLLWSRMYCGVVTTRSADVVEILESEEKELYSETTQLKGKAVTSCTIANIYRQPSQKWHNEIDMNSTASRFYRHGFKYHDISK